MLQEVCFRDLGIKRYKEVWDYQEALLKENTDLKAAFRKMETSPDAIPTKNFLLFVEHPPVYTLGKSGNEHHLLLNEETLSKRGIDYFHINRGGDITFHGPEQLVGYPILDLEKFKPDLGWYLRSLEEVIIQTLRDFGIRGDRSPGETGVWLDPQIPGKERKICAMGIKCSRWISMHGFALNVNTDLNYFYDIVPCGIPDKQVTSMEKEIGKEVEMETVKYLIKKNFEKVFDCTLYVE